MTTFNPVGRIQARAMHDYFFSNCLPRRSRRHFSAAIAGIRCALRRTFVALRTRSKLPGRVVFGDYAVARARNWQRTSCNW